jgi:hypothetical protein
MSGMGQGNGAAPTSWAVISTPMLEIMRKRGHCTHFKALISKDEIKIVGFAFVDDKDLLRASAPGEKTYQEVGQDMQRGLDLWEGLLKATGGALVPEKSFWYLIDFEWNNGVWRYSKVEEIPFELTMNDKDEIRHVLTRLPVNEARRSLGCRSAPDGNTKEQVAYMRSVAVEWRDRLRAGHLTRYEAWTALSTCVMKTLLYPAPALTISKAEANHIMAPIVMSSLNAMGMQWFLPRAVVYAPLKYQGLAVPNLYIETGIQHVTLLLQETHARSTTGLLIRMSIEAIKVEIGIGGSLFSQSFNRYGILATKSWVKHTWQFLSEFDMTVADQVGDIRLRRQGDCFLTDSFIQHGFKGAALKKLNACRLFLRVETLSDITTADGRYIAGWVLEGRSEANPNVYHAWPTQGNPGRQEWLQWRQALACCFCGGYLAHGLLNSLGSWTDRDTTEWQWWYSLQEERIYRHLQEIWHFYSVRRMGRQTRMRRFIYGGTVELDDLPARLRRATVQWSGNGILQLTGYSEVEPSLHLPDQQGTPTMAQRISNSGVGMRWAVEHSVVLDDGATLAEAIRRGHAIAVCDGSYKDMYGTAAYVLEGVTSVNRIVAVVVVPGMPEDQSSFRSELAGLYGVVAMVQLICERHGITNGEIEVGCDCEGALGNVFTPGEYFEASIKQADYDLLSAIRKMLSMSPLKWVSRHVAGHQDDGTEVLDRWANLNIEMDSLAKVFWNDMHDTPPTANLPITNEYWPVYISGNKISSRLDARIREHVLGREQCERWVRKGRLTNASLQQVNWKACEQAMKSLSIGKRHWIAKHVSGHAGIGIKMVQWQLRDSAACPRCGQEEDCRHVWTCHAPDARWTRLQHIVKLDTWLEQQDTHPALRRELVNGLKAWSVGTQRCTSYRTPLHIGQALLQQDEIGWTNLLEGCMANGWTDAQELYYRSIGSRRSGLRWTVAIIKKLWDVAWDLWEQRNGFLHARENQEVLHDMVNVDAEIRFQFQRGRQTLSRRSRYLFDGEVEELLQTSIHTRQQWLASVTAARAMAVERQAQEDQGMAASRQLMRAWLAGNNNRTD